MRLILSFTKKGRSNVWTKICEGCQVESTPTFKEFVRCQRKKRESCQQKSNTLRKAKEKSLSLHFTAKRLSLITNLNENKRVREEGGDAYWEGRPKGPAEKRRGRMEGNGVAGGEKVKQEKKRPASLRDGEEVKSSKAKNIDDEEVEEFFAILRNMRKLCLLRKDNPRNPSFRAEDFAHVCRTGGCCGCGSSKAAGGGGSGRVETETAQPSRNDHYDAEDEWEGSEDNGPPAGLDLNVEPCRGSSQERRGGRSVMAEGEDE